MALVDDDPNVVQVLGTLLRRAGYPVAAYEHPGDVLADLPHAGLTVLVTDLEMPGMDGIELSRRMLDAVPDLAVIVLTGGATARSAADSLRLGIMEYLQKPLGNTVLEEGVARALEIRRGNILRRTAGP